MKTVTYATKDSPFLAIRCLKQLTLEHKTKYLKTLGIIENSFYMDDLLVGLDNVVEAITVYSKITESLSQHILKYDQLLAIIKGKLLMQELFILG